ncbi:hypothetical protein WN55_06551 [Dufourea novaeangliae]|uniref:Uncharacterized protein n=1 Tax=Dufourea novaeangliae TaxID=178035 RepID=A0A154PQI2_DUFNO|nr:hypothetical protein WN55_06551 [Dufourea novaeangliae]
MHGISCIVDYYLRQRDSTIIAKQSDLYLVLRGYLSAYISENIVHGRYEWCCCP